MDGTETAGLQLPRLPQLDRRDIEAVRNFLPGKVLGRTAALLSLLLLVLGLAGSVDWMLEQRLGIHLQTMPWLRATVLGGVPLLVVATQVMLEWQAERQRRRLQALAIEPSRVPFGYFRIGPYFAADRERFDRADEAQWKVLNWIRYAGGVPLYLTGDSGCGKSSLLNACVIPILREAGWTVVEARAWQDPVAALRQALRHISGVAAEQPHSLRTAMEAATAAVGGNLLVVMDQFEEFVVLSTDEARAGLVTLFDDLRADPIAGLRVLVVLRSDYEALIEECGLPRLRQSDNHVFVGRFTLTASRSFMGRSSLGLTNEQLMQLLATAAALDETPGLVRPITLNVLGTGTISRPTHRAEPGRQTVDPPLHRADRRSAGFARSRAGRTRVADQRIRDQPADAGAGARECDEAATGRSTGRDERPGCGRAGAATGQRAGRLGAVARLYRPCRRTPSRSPSQGDSASQHRLRRTAVAGAHHCRCRPGDGMAMGQPGSGPLGSRGTRIDRDDRGRTGADRIEFASVARTVRHLGAIARPSEREHAHQVGPAERRERDRPCAAQRPDRAQPAGTRRNRGDKPGAAAGPAECSYRRRRHHIAAGIRAGGGASPLRRLSGRPVAAITVVTAALSGAATWCAR